MICKVTENPCERLHVKGLQVSYEVYLLLYEVPVEFSFAGNKNWNWPPGNREHKQDLSLFTQVTTTSFLVKVIGTVSLSLLQLHLTQEWWRCLELTKFRSQGDLEGFPVLHTSRLAKISHFQLWSGRQGYIQEANSFCPSPEMPHVTSTDGTSCKEQVKTGCSTQPKTWLSPARHIIASTWKQN